MRGVEGRSQRVSDALFPSRKLHVFEMFVWHGLDAPVIPGVTDLARLQAYGSAGKASFACLDGHAGQVNAAQLAPVLLHQLPNWVMGPFQSPVEGIWGRDLD